MFMFTFISLLGVSLALPSDFVLPPLKEGGQHWALLVAGSNGWFNYRHQADVCHAYHVMKNHGIKDENIVVMMVDDIAENKENPTKGIIINRPGGNDVYKGVPKDYTGLLEVVPDVFLKVLQGDKEGLYGTGSGKVINSGPNDNVFVNFVDHGGPGIVAFGSKFLHAIDFIKVLENMHKEEKYGKMLIYLETCESGSMFEYLLRKDLNILAVTAANATTSSYACYFDKKRKTYLGDVFSVNWMQDSDKENLKKETIGKQVKIVKRETNTSMVSQYGDLGMDSLSVAEFQGKAKSKISQDLSIPDPNDGAVPSEDVEMNIYSNMMNLAETEEERNLYAEKLEKESLRRGRVADLVQKIVSAATNNNEQTERIMRLRMRQSKHDCYKTVLEYLADNCKQLELRKQFGYALKHLYAFVNLCEENVPVETITEAVDKTC